MQYDDVVTFFHEFGHLMHNILGGQQTWSEVAGFATETDFVEAPSQMLEEFFHDPGILRSFAKHYQTNEALPVEPAGCEGNSSYRIIRWTCTIALRSKSTWMRF
jgi:thimet oligopeptidase